MTDAQYPIGVLMMAYGGPGSLEEIPGYLADIRSGRPTTPEVLAEITNNYRQIGGRSPLLEWTRRQVEAVATYFDPALFRFYLGMRHWAPWIEETVRDMLEDGITHAISLVLAPHYSAMSIAKYQQKIEAGMEMYRGEIE
ncbi:MAG: ferrochelatase, partial [Ardenticatenaceae bacterium]